MEFFVKKLIMVFFVTILFLTCSSYAATFPPYKLGSMKWPFDIPPWKKDVTVPNPRTINYHDTLPIYKPPKTNEKEVPKSTSPSLVVRDGRQTPPEETGIAERLFGPDGAKNFRTGWKVGKKVYSVIGECEKYKDYFTCPLPSSDDCSTSDEENSALHCVLELTQGNITCHEDCGVPPETPCSYIEGVYKGCTSLKYASATAPASAPGYAVPPPPPADTSNYAAHRLMVIDHTLYQCLAIIFTPFFLAIYLSI